MKKITLLIVLLLSVGLGFGQTRMLAQLDFETPGGYSTNVTEFTNGTDDYFLRTDGSNITGTVLSNIQDSYYFTAQDTYPASSTLPLRLLLDNVNISGYSSLEFRVYLAEDDNGTTQDWDGPDFVHFNYDIDNSGAFSELLWIESTGSDTEPQIDTNFDNVGDGASITDTFSQFIQSIPNTGSLLDIEVVFRLNTGGDDIAIDNIEIWGTLVPCATTVTWNGSLPWVGGTPDETTIVELNGDYDTFIDGSFSACSLIVNSGTLTIANNTFVEVQNDLTATGNITVQPQGAFIQNNDFGSVSGSGTIEVIKQTAPMRAWYEYTYWSSPVQNETFDALFETNPNRRFIFNAQNYLDATAEVGNNDATDHGQDDIDDNGDDWVWVSGTTTMDPGVGYAATLSPMAYNIAPGGASKQITLAPFEGLFNNGVYDVPIYRNDSEKADNNWNLIGNPYPSAIDAHLFIAANANIETSTGTYPPGVINGAIYLWSQDADPSPIANGNQALNFSDSDFAIINGITSVIGGDGNKPIDDRMIPSGQAFFVTMSNSAPATLVSGDVYTSDVTFSNSMRVANTTANSQFFKNTSSKGKANPNKLWINLTSNQGAFNQTAVAYIEGATDNFDGAYFDASRPAGIVTASILYSNIEGSTKKLAIQGKAANSINEDEVISLGFKTNTDEVTLLTLSIDHLQGDFLTTNTIYLKDNLLNKLHNLTDSDYTFTSEVGEFNTRFDIVFSANALSVNNIDKDVNALKIVELQDDQVQFSMSNSLSIKSVRIYDLLGRQLYNLSGSRSVEVYNLSNLSNTIYVAKVQLSNGALITKKAIKR